MATKRRLRIDAYPLYERLTDAPRVEQSAGGNKLSLVHT